MSTFSYDVDHNRVKQRVDPHVAGSNDNVALHRERDNECHVIATDHQHGRANTKTGLSINPDYKALLPEPSLQEYHKLEESIKTEGLYYPIIINEDNVILDGHTRYQICQKLGIPPRTEVKRFTNPLLEKLFVIESNLSRRHLNDYQKVELALPYLEIQRQLARERQLAGLQQGTELSSGPFGPDENGRVRDIVGKKIGVPGRTVQRALKVINEGSEELKEKARKGEISISAAAIQVKRAEKHSNPPRLPEGEYDVLYADPPWTFDFSLEGDPREHYPVMDIDDICAMKIPSAKIAILFLWVPNAKLLDGLRVMNAWGFSYVTNFVWIKDTKGLGYFSMAQHELLLIGKKGGMPPPEAQNRPSSVIRAKRTQHSEKPDTVYARIEKMYPGRKYLELFARKHRLGWCSWGDEIE